MGTFLLQQIPMDEIPVKRLPRDPLEPPQVRMQIFGAVKNDTMWCLSCWVGTGATLYPQLFKTADNRLFALLTLKGGEVCTPLTQAQLINGTQPKKVRLPNKKVAVLLT